MAIRSRIIFVLLLLLLLLPKVSAQTDIVFQKMSILHKVLPNLHNNSIQVNGIDTLKNGQWLLCGAVNPDPKFVLQDYWLGCSDTNGSILWEKTWHAKGDDQLTCATQTPDGGYMLAGSSSSGAGGDKTAPHFGMKDYWLIKLDANLGIEWQQTLGGSQEDF
jgi:hypothetical protein